MRQALSLLALLAPVAVFAACGETGMWVTTSSSSSSVASSGNPVCAPGAQIACACPGGGQGAQVCANNGGGYGPCVGCGGAGSSSTGTGATGGAGGQGSSSTGSTSSSGAGGMGGGCAVNQDCVVSWASDIFGDIIAAPTHNCAGSGTGITKSCHGDGKGGLTLSPTDSHSAYVALTDWTIKNVPEVGMVYVVPCDTDGSGILCNVNVDDGNGGVGVNPFGVCGSAMPLFGANLTMVQLAQIADWIACGAPEN